MFLTQVQKVDNRQTVSKTYLYCRSMSGRPVIRVEIDQFQKLFSVPAINPKVTL
jgi:hypothetical protein